MLYDYIAIADAEIPTAAEPVFQHLLVTYASEANKVVSMWRAIPEECLDFKPHEKVNTIRTILVHQLLSERRFLRAISWTSMSRRSKSYCRPGEIRRPRQRISKNICLAGGSARLPQLFAAQRSAWWLAERPFFGGLMRERIWIFWRRVLHTCHHRTQVQTWLRLAGQHVPTIYGPSGDVHWSEADPTYSLAAAKRRISRQLRIHFGSENHFTAQSSVTVCRNRTPNI